MNIKLVCMDLDGTLFAHAGEIPDVNIKALRECEKRGIRLALVSGRGFPFIRRTAERIGVDCAIVSANGARIEASVNGPLVFEGTFTEDEGRRVMDTMLEAEVNFEAYTREVNYVVHPELAPERHIRSLQMNVQAGEAEGATTTYEAWGKDQKWNTSLFHPWATAPLIVFAKGVRPYYSF